MVGGVGVARAACAFPVSLDFREVPLPIHTGEIAGEQAFSIVQDAPDASGLLAGSHPWE